MVKILMEDKKMIGWGQLLLLLFMCRVFTLMTFVPFADSNETLTVRMAATAIGAVIQGILLIPIVILKKSITGLALEKNKPAGIILTVLYLVFFLFYTAGGLIDFRRFLGARFFPTAADADNALWIGVLLIVGVYCGYLGIEALGRSAVLLFWIFIAALVIMCISSVHEIDPANLSFGFTDKEGLFSAVLKDLSRNGEICALAFLAGNVRDRLRCGAYGLLASKLVLIFAATLLITAVLGDFAFLTQYPFLAVGATGDARFVERGDALYLMVWTITAIINIALFLHISAGLIGEVFPKCRYRTVISAVMVFILTTCFTLTGLSFTKVYDIICSGWSVILLAGVLPLTVLLVGLTAQRKGGKKSDA